MKNHYNKILFSIALCLVFTACSKSWLEEKPNKALVVPQTIKDLQAILDAEYTINQQSNTGPIRSMDLVYIADEDLGQLDDIEREMYIWKKDLHYSQGGQNFDWNYYFTLIESANLVLDGIVTLDKNSAEVQDLLGQAHFLRAFGYYQLAQSFCKPYVKATASSDLGLPIRLSSDVNQIQQRSNLQQCYDQIILDLQQAIDNLAPTAKYFTRASKTSSLALLSKVYLIMGDYPKATEFANEVITLKPELIDFNDTKYASHSYAYKFRPKGLGNPEIIFYATSFLTYFETSYVGGIVQVNHDFYNTYGKDDLRKEFFYNISDNRINFVGSYTGDNPFFQGISINEMYFIRSECNARIGNLQDARNDLNFLLTKRYKSGRAPVITENNADELLSIILKERTKEFPRFCNIWWEDIRRLNLNPKTERTMYRIVNGKNYTLPANDSRFVFPIPDKEINLSGLQQNER